MTDPEDRCHVCGGPAHTDPAGGINVNSGRALLEELRHLAMNHGATGLQSPSTKQRLRALQRVSWLAARMAWLETEELLTTSGEMPRVDLDDTADLATVREWNKPRPSDTPPTVVVMRGGGAGGPHRDGGSGSVTVHRSS